MIIIVSSSGINFFATLSLKKKIVELRNRGKYRFKMGGGGGAFYVILIYIIDQTQSDRLSFPPFFSLLLSDH